MNKSMNSSELLSNFNLWTIYVYFCLNQVSKFRKTKSSKIIIIISSEIVSSMQISWMRFYLICLFSLLLDSFKSVSEQVKSISFNELFEFYLYSDWNQKTSHCNRQRLMAEKWTKGEKKKPSQESRVEKFI